MTVQNRKVKVARLLDLRVDRRLLFPRCTKKHSSSHGQAKSNALWRRLGGGVRWRGVRANHGAITQTLLCQTSHIESIQTDTQIRKQSVTHGKKYAHTSEPSALKWSSACLRSSPFMEPSRRCVDERGKTNSVKHLAPRRKLPKPSQSLPLPQSYATIIQPLNCSPWPRPKLSSRWQPPANRACFAEDGEGAPKPNSAKTAQRRKLCPVRTCREPSSPDQKITVG